MPDPGQIQVQLSLLSAQDSQAAQQLATSLGQISKMFEALRSSDFRETAEKMGQLHAKMVQDTQRLADQAAQIQQNAGRGSSTSQKAFDMTRAAQEVARAANPNPDREEYDRRAQENRDRNEAERARVEKLKQDLRDSQEQRRRVADDEAKRQQEAEKARLDERRQRMETMTDEQRQAEFLRYHAKTNIPGIGSGAGDDPNQWYNRVDTTAGRETGFRIPRFGELNVQDYLNQARDHYVRQAMETDDPGEQERLGERAARLQKWSNRVGYAYAGRNLMRRASGFLGEQNFNPVAFTDEGAQLGYRRDSQNFLGNIGEALGIQTPFNAAGREGARMSWDTNRMRFSAGINNEQARAITNASVSAGFGGDLGSDIRTKLMAPMVRQFGLDPQTLIPFTQVLRTGTGSIQDLNRELGNLGETARSANVNVNTMAQSLSNAGEASQAAGGYYMQGVRFGNQFTAATGLLPDVGTQLGQNPLVQAQLAANTGLPGFAQAAASPIDRIQATTQSARRMYQAYAGSIGEQGRATQIRDAGGNVLGRVRGDNPAMASTAAYFGVNSDQMEKLLRGGNQTDRTANLEAALSGYEERGQQLYGRQLPQIRDRAAGRVRELNDKYTTREFRFNERNGQIQFKNKWGGGWQTDKGETEKVAGSSNDQIMGELSNSREGVLDRGDLFKLGREAGLSKKELDHALDAGSVKKQTSNIRKLVSEHQAEQEAKYQIAFTGPAAKFFKALVNQNRDLPGVSGMEAATSSRGPSQLSPQSNSGLSPADSGAP